MDPITKYIKSHIPTWQTSRHALATPYRHSFIQLNQAFSSTPNPLISRIASATLGVLLLTPLLNLIVEISLRILGINLDTKNTPLPAPIAAESSTATPASPETIVPPQPPAFAEPATPIPAPAPASPEAVTPPQPSALAEPATAIPTSAPASPETIVPPQPPALAEPATPIPTPAPASPEAVTPPQPPALAEPATDIPTSAPASPEIIVPPQPPALTEPKNTATAASPDVQSSAKAPISPKGKEKASSQKKQARRPLKRPSHFESAEMRNDLVNETKETLIARFLRFQNDPNNQGETPSFFDQTIHNLRNQNKLSWDQIDEVVEYVGMQLFHDQDSQLTLAQRSYLIYRLLNEATVSRATESFVSLSNAKREFFQEIQAPGDGNCFLWSCVLGLEILQASDKPKAVSQVSTLADYSSLKAKQVDLREKLVNNFLNAIQDPQDLSFRRRFIGYLMGNAELTSILPQNAAQQEEMYNSGDIPQDVILGYLEKISSNGSWNGEFEAELVAQILERPIVILGADRKFRTIAGGQFLEANQEPLYVRHLGNHYNTLIYSI